jgi:putative SOS response-associated peptidase YedK
MHSHIFVRGWQNEIMCGRFVLDRKVAELVSLFEVDIIGDHLPEPSWNIAPTSTISVVIDSMPRATAPDDFPEPVRRIEAARWGLVPAGSGGPASGPPLFNARSEDVATKPSFAAAVAKRRAVVPASGYYEWREIEGTKRPFYVSLPGDELMLFAGLYEWWRTANPKSAEDAKWLLSATILTRSSTGPLTELHDRAPVLLDADLVEEWLDPAEDGSQDLVDYVASAAVSTADRVTFHEVAAAVGSVANNGPQLVSELS